MEVSESTTTERTVTVNGVQFTVRELANPLGWLRRGEIKDELVNTSVLRRMKEAGLVRKKTSGGFMSMSDEDPVTKWEQVDNKCKELFDRLNEPYYRLRPKVDTMATPSSFGMLDEQEHSNARERAERVVAELNERNPDVTFKVDEEQLNAFPTQ